MYKKNKLKFPRAVTNWGITFNEADLNLPHLGLA